MVKTGQRRLPLMRFAESRALGLEVMPVTRLANRPETRRPHRTDFHHLLLVTHGRGTHVLDFHRWRLEPGMAVWVAPGQVHRFGHEPGLEATMVVFRAEALREPVTLEPCTRLPPDRLRLATALLDGLATECAVSDRSLRSRTFLATLLQALVRTVDAGAERPGRTDLSARFAAALEREIRRTREVSAYAAILRCSTRTLTRHCLDADGKSAKRVIEERLLLEARRSLAHDGISVAALSTQLGFAEPTQFVKFFRRVSGETPGRFRARMAK